MISVFLYIRTIAHLKPSQVLFRFARRLNVPVPLRWFHVPKPQASSGDFSRVAILPELDFDPVFLKRFDCEDILQNRLELLHHIELVDWETCWNAKLSTPLWRFNLHYFEYLLPMAKRTIDTGNQKWVDKAKAIVVAWIRHCPRSNGGDAWHPYTISLRIVNWFAFFGELDGVLKKDECFVQLVKKSLLEQYVYLSRHLEKDLLANHYFENLKALVLCALFFNDNNTLKFVLPDFEAQCNEQILADGMHFELSPMYHKIIMEDLLRVATSLSNAGIGIPLLHDKLQKMANCLHSMERGTNRTPLFNDSGDNVAKHKNALLQCAERNFGIRPAYQRDLFSAGYFFIEREYDGHLVKIIFDAGIPAPPYAMAHAHCDALSFECFIDGEPWVVNSGTYAYQNELRDFFRSAVAHNTATIDGCEQSECWGEHRVARFSKAKLIDRGDCWVKGSCRDMAGNMVIRTLTIENGQLEIRDQAIDGSKTISSQVHLIGSQPIKQCGIEMSTQGYSPEFGLKKSSRVYSYEGQGEVLAALEIPFDNTTILGDVI